MKIILAFLLIIFGFQAQALEYRTYEFSDLWEKMGYPHALEKAASEEAQSDLDTYTSKEDTWYKDINAYLRNFPQSNYDWDSISPDQARPMVKNIDSIFSKLKSLPEDILLYRGVDLKYRKNKSFNVGEEFVEKGYASTSTSYKVADYFANHINDNEKTPSLKAIFVLYSMKKNLKGILIDQDEDEVLLSHGERIRIMEVDRSHKYDIYLAQVCAEVCSSLLPSGLNLSKTHFNSL